MTTILFLAPFLAVCILIIIALMTREPDYSKDIERLQKQIRDAEQKHGKRSDLTRRLVDLRCQQLRSE